MLGIIKNLKNKYNLQVQYLHSNDTGENVAFEGLGVEFEHTAPGMPQQNGNVEQKFATLFNQMCNMINCGKFNAFLQNGLWAKAANTTKRTLSPF